MTGSYENAEHIKGEIAYVCFIQSENSRNFKQAIIQYINKTSKKVEYFLELVNAYNENFFFREQEHLEFLNINELELDIKNDGSIDYDQYLFEAMEMIYQNRIDYINKNHLQDICTYENWPKAITEEKNETLDDETPY